MSSIVNTLLGNNNKGTAFQPASANIVQPSTADQANAQYGNAQTGLQGQQALLAALAQQNGLKNQSNVYNQLQNVASGQGPNPAQAMLANATGQNVANQASLMAGQRGVGANTGLLARQAAQQGANIQQQAAGQGAALQANQSLNALGQMGGMATNQANQQANATNAYTNAAQGEQGQILGSINAQNNANIANQSNLNSINGQMAQGAQTGQFGLLGGASNALGAAMPMIGSGLGGIVNYARDLFNGTTAGGIGAAASGAGTAMAGGAADAAPLLALAAQGGKVPNYDEGGTIPNNTTPLQQSTGATSGPMSALGKFLTGTGTSPDSSTPLQDSSNYKSAYNILGSSQSPQKMAKGGAVQALVSPGEQYIPPEDIPKVKAGANPLEVGERIPGKPKHKGNDYRNDTVAKTLKSGGLVLPNSVMQAKHPQWEAHKFVAAHLAKGGMVKKGKC